jgi:nitrate reductase alpha subunit
MSPRRLKSGELQMSCEDPDDPANWPRNMFVWRSNLLGSSGKGHEYFLKHLLGTTHGVMGKDLGEKAAAGAEAVWHDEAPEGKLDLLVTLDFRMSTTCVYSDIVLPTATWYEKNDLNTSDMHPFIHPLSSAAIRPGRRAATGTSSRASPRSSRKSRRKCSASRRTSCWCPSSTTRRRDGPAVRRQGLEEGRDRADPRQDHADGRGGRARLSPTSTSVHLARPADDKLGNGGKGIAWNTEHEVEALGR